VLKQSVSNFCEQNFVKLSEIKYPRNPSPKSRKHWSEAYTRQMAISQPVFDYLICAGTKYEQLQRTKLHKITWNQVSTKSFTEVQKTLIRGKYSSDCNKPKVFRFPNLCWNKVWASLANRTPTRQVKLSIHEILHQLLKDWTETLLPRDHQSQMLHTNIYNHSLLYFLTIQYFISITVFHCVCEMYQIGRVVSFQVDPEIVLCKRRVVKYRLFN